MTSKYWRHVVLLLCAALVVCAHQLPYPFHVAHTGAVKTKLDSVIADADLRARTIVNREARTAGSDPPSNSRVVRSIGQPSPSTLHRIMNMPKPMTHGMVHGALKAEIAFANLTFLMQEDDTFHPFISDERFRRTVMALITQDCVNTLNRKINCHTVNTKTKSSLPEFNLRDYYTFDGTCNNKVHKTAGSTPIPLKRFLPAQYDSLPSTPRQTGRNKLPLPSARAVSNVMSNGTQNNDPVFTMMGVTWGQFLDHDVDLTCAGNFDAGQSCANVCLSATPRSACLPIKVGNNDENLDCRAGKCIPFTRSCPACVRHKRWGYVPSREQINQITSFIDAGLVYGGPDPEEQHYWKKLVDLSTGKMKIQKSTFNTDLLPNATVDADKCEGGCFLAGDTRANEVTGLTALHIIFVREHNLLVDELRAVNPKWTPTKLYLEARRIVAAEIQHITYNEFVPLLLGTTLSDYSYSSRFDASTTNAFATASFRYAHSSITEEFKRVDSAYNEIKALDMFDAFFDTNHLREPGTLDNILRGMSVQEGLRADNRFSDSVRNRLFETGNNGCGLDLFALNVQRGRDHGLPSYNKWRDFVRRYCGVTTGRVSSFAGLRSEISQERIRLLQSVYDHVDDIDLYVGGLAENLHYNAATGPTFWCLNTFQFIHFRHGDRLFYENTHVFPYNQFHEIRKITLAKIICRNGDNIDRIPPYVMKIVPKTQLVYCRDLPGININQWKSHPYHHHG